MFATHKLTGEKLQVLKIYGGLVAKCEQSEEIIITEKPYLATKIQICKTENLIFEQPTLF